ncbi:MAG: hypothetical protein OER86_00280 [Phycisphaerae bacterium]|nr:hypothetical protein [Phycisphaerae bacterium]
MSEHLHPDPHSLPSHSQLFKATGVSLIVATILLVSVVLPAEYGIDPTGIGTTLGLTAMGRPPSANSEPVAPVVAKPDDAVVKRAVPFRTDTMTLTLGPGRGAEIKASMKAGDDFVFTWKTDGGAVNFDMHGEQPQAGNDFTSFWKGRQQTNGHGSFVAPFAGSHGWYWGNRGAQPVTVTVTTAGFYEKLYEP